MNYYKQKNITNQLSKMMIKARHLHLFWIISVQSYSYIPKILRRQMTYFSVFYCKKNEFQLICEELINYNKEQAITIFKYCFDKPYAHMDIDLYSNKIYKNFNELIITEN